MPVAAPLTYLDLKAKLCRGLADPSRLSLLERVAE